MYNSSHFNGFMYLRNRSNSSTLEALWFSDKHVKIVSGLLSGQRESYALCQNCPLPPTAQAPKGQRIKLKKGTIKDLSRLLKKEVIDNVFQFTEN